MNPKLHRTVMALSAAAAVFTLLLLAGSPAQPSPAPAPVMLLSADAGSATETAGFIADTSPVSDSQRRHQRHSRALLALPYFSFAQGLRRNRS